MRKTILFIFILLTFSFAAPAQEYEYGKPSELKGLTKIYINTATDVESHDIFTKEIEKANLPSLEIVDTANDAQIILMYEGGKSDVLYGGTTMQRSAGKGFVAIKGKDTDKLRLLMNFENTKNTILEKKPAEKLAKEFVKQYKIANGLKGR